jgi:2-methylcitrate dehydratase PrpD
MSTYPGHYEHGWHITGTAGVFGAAVGASYVLDLDTTQIVAALGMAGTFAAGVREVFGTSGKPLHAGRAAQAGLHGAVWAKAGLTGPEDIIGGRRGFWAILCPDGHAEETLVGSLGSHWECRKNALKPFANGIVSHPLQDAGIRIKQNHSPKPEDIESIDAQVHHLVLELMNKPHPKTALEAKFSHQHCIAAALIDGAGHDAQSKRYADPVISALRESERKGKHRDP